MEGEGVAGRDWAGVGVGCKQSVLFKIAGYAYPVAWKVGG